MLGGERQLKKGKEEGKRGGRRWRRRGGGNNGEKCEREKRRGEGGGECVYLGTGLLSSLLLQFSIQRMLHRQAKCRQLVITATLFTFTFTPSL